MFLLGAAVWQFACFVGGWFYRKLERKTEKLKPKPLQGTQRTPKFWLQDSLCVCALYIATCAIGEIPMAVNYFAAVRGWLHWWWSNAVTSRLIPMIAVWWILERIYEPWDR